MKKESGCNKEELEDLIKSGLPNVAIFLAAMDCKPIPDRYYIAAMKARGESPHPMCRCYWDEEELIKMSKDLNRKGRGK
ncbi:hypothetical protein J7K24_02155 [bacterium]|nr:hypothetical protein [bacterium]